MRESKPVMIMVGGLTNRIYAVHRYTERGDGLYIAATNGKDDVTEQAIRAVAEHRAKCVIVACPCRLHLDCQQDSPEPSPVQIPRGGDG